MYYIYQITNMINQKNYIGQTNNIVKRWSNHRCISNPNMVIAQAIKKYGVENFKFEILLSGLTKEEANEKEINYIKEKNSLVPNGYNVSKGGQGANGVRKYGSDNSNAHLTEEEAQYILDNRNIPMLLLYKQFENKISYEQFKKVYHHKIYTNLTAHSDEYPYNAEFSNELTSGNKLTYDQIIDIRKRYANGEYWLDVYKDYQDIYENKWIFWNVYYGNRYSLIMPEVFTEENRKRHSKIGRAGERNGRAKLKEEDVLNIRKLHSEGTFNKEIYNLYPQVTTTSIRDIINNKTWKNLL